MGIFIAIPIFLAGNKDWWPNLTNSSSQFLGILVFLFFILWLYKNSKK